MSLNKVVLGAAVLCLVIGGGRSLLKASGKAGTEPMAAVASVPTSASGVISLNADWTGHFTTNAMVDGRVAAMLVDTGATLCVLREEEAENFGLGLKPKDYSRPINTANGIVLVAPVRIKLLQIGPIAVRNVDAVVIPRGRLSTNLLGMSFLSRLREFNISGSRITLKG